MSLQKVYPVYSFQYIQNKLVELSRQKLNYADLPEQVQADWTETDITSYAYIKNKPTIPAVIGDVVGPASSVDGDVVLFDGTTGKLIKDSGVLFTDVMLKSVYDTDNSGVVDKAEGITILGRNSTGATLYKGSIVYISGSTGNRPNFTLSKANAESTSAGTFGMILADIPNNTDGYVMCAGFVDNLDTRTTASHPITAVTLADGDKLYLDPNNAGYVTNVKPSAPNHLVYIGVVTRTSPTNGTIVLRIQNGYELDELHDVAIATPVNNDILTYESSTSLWKNKTVATALGYTPVPSTRTLTINGTAYDLSADRSWTISAGMTNPMTTAGDIIYGGASGTPTRLPIGTSGYILQAGASAPSWFNLFGTANTFTATQTISSSVSGGSFSALVLKNTSASTSQFVQIELQTGTGFYGGLKGFNDGNAGNTGQVLTLYSSKGLVFNTLGRSGAAVANTDPDMVWITSNSVSSMALFSNTASPYARLQLYTANAGNSYTEISFNGAGNITRIKGVTGGSANAGYGLLGHATTDIMRWDVNGVYIGGTTAPTANLHIIGSTTAKSSLRIASGTAPTTPNDGDIWYDGTNIKIRVGSTTKTFTIV